MRRPCRLPPAPPNIVRPHLVANIHSCSRLAGMAERGVETQTVAGAEAVERDREVLKHA